MASIRLAAIDDGYLAGLKKEADGLRVLSYADAVKVQLPSGPLMSRDPLAVSAGLKSAPHQEIIAEIVELRSPVRCVRELARIATLASEHIERATGEPAMKLMPLGTTCSLGTVARSSG